MITMIWCQDPNWGISLNNKLPWHDKEEMQHFKNTTLNHICVMGRKTYDSIGKPLKDRENIILTRDKNIVLSGVKICNDILEIIELGKEKNIYIIGGKEIYEYFIEYANILIISIMKKEYECDLFLKIDLNKFEFIKKEEYKDFYIYYYKK